MPTRDELLARVASDWPTGQESDAFLILDKVLGQLRPDAVEALTPSMVRRICGGGFSYQSIYDTLMYLTGSVGLFEIGFHLRDELGQKVAVGAREVLQKMQSGERIVNPATGEEESVDSVEVSFRGTEVLREALT